MKKSLLGIYLGMLVGLLSTAGLIGQSEQTSESEVKKKEHNAAVFVLNRAGKIFDSRVQAYEDRIIAAVAGHGLNVISREDALSSIKPTEIDEAFLEQTSAIRLAQTLGADYLLIVSLVSFDQEDRTFDGYGITTKNVICTLESAYRLVTLVKGASVKGDTVVVTETSRQTVNMMESGGSVLNKLLSRSATELGNRVNQAAAGGLASAEKLPSQVEVVIQATMQDLSVPDVVKGENGQYQVTANTYQLEVFGANIEVNGLTIGTTSATQSISVPAGVNRLKISRPGYEPVERMVNFVEGQRLLIPMTMDEKGMKRMMEMTALLRSLKKDAALTDAEISRIEGIATYFRQSGIRIDRREDIKVDTDQPIKVEQTQNSLFR